MSVEGPLPGGLLVVRHGATEWSLSGQHTGSTDLPLVPAGRRRAQGLAEVLDPKQLGRVLSSPLRRARETCELAGFAGERVELIDDLREWDYGEYEGLTSAEIRERRPDWDLWRDGCPGGESPSQVADRADRVIGLVRPDVTTIAFAHGHILRVLAARWIEMEAAAGARLVLAAGALGLLGHEHEVRAVRGWNVADLRDA